MIGTNMVVRNHPFLISTQLEDAGDCLIEVDLLLVISYICMHVCVGYVCTSINTHVQLELMEMSKIELCDSIVYWFYSMNYG